MCLAIAAEGGGMSSDRARRKKNKPWSRPTIADGENEERDLNDCTAVSLRLHAMQNPLPKG